jgi:hypothetical protein
MQKCMSGVPAQVLSSFELLWDGSEAHAEAIAGLLTAAAALSRFKRDAA